MCVLDHPIASCIINRKAESDSLFALHKLHSYRIASLLLLNDCGSIIILIISRSMQSYQEDASYLSTRILLSNRLIHYSNTHTHPNSLTIVRIYGSQTDDSVGDDVDDVPILEGD